MGLGNNVSEGKRRFWKMSLMAITTNTHRAGSNILPVYASWPVRVVQTNVRAISGGDTATIANAFKNPLHRTTLCVTFRPRNLSETQKNVWRGCNSRMAFLSRCTLYYTPFHKCFTVCAWETTISESNIVLKISLYHQKQCLEGMVRKFFSGESFQILSSARGAVVTRLPLFWTKIWSNLAFILLVKLFGLTRIKAQLLISIEKVLSFLYFFKYTLLHKTQKVYSSFTSKINLPTTTVIRIMQHSFPGAELTLRNTLF